MSALAQTLQFLVTVVFELTVLFLGISTLVALLLMVVPPERIRGWLSRRGLTGNVLAALLGALTPFCACSTIPMTLGMLQAGAPFGPVMSFLIASPLLNPYVLGMIATLIGLRACGVYFLVTFLGAVSFGVILERFAGTGAIRDSRIRRCCGVSGGPVVPASFLPRLRLAFGTAWSDFRGVAGYLVAGVAVGAWIHGYLPQGFLVEVAGPGNPVAIPVAAVIGVPLYIRAETALPIGMALARKGMSLGAVMALVIGGAGMALPEMSLLAGIFHRRVVAAVVAAIFTTAVLGGLAFEALL